MKYFLCLLFSFLLCRVQAQVSVPSELFYPDILQAKGYLVGSEDMRDRSFARQVLVYPNPSNGWIWVSIHADQSSLYRIIIFSADGRIYQRKSYPIEPGINKYYLSLPSTDIENPLFLKVENLKYPQAVILRVLRQ